MSSKATRSYPASSSSARARSTSRAADHELAAEDDVVDDVAVDGELERLANARVLRQRVVAFAGVGDVDRDALVPEARSAGQYQVGVRADGAEVGGSRPLDHLEVAGLEVRQAHAAVGDGQIHDAVDGDGFGVPVVGEALYYDAVLRDALDEAEGARAHRSVAEVLARGLCGGGRHHHAGAIGQLRDQGRERLAQVELDRVGVHHGDGLELSELTCAVGAGQVLGPLEVVLHRLGVHGRAVVERHVRLKVDGDGEAILRSGVAGGKLRHDGGGGGDVEELVADACEDDATDVGAPQVRVEDVGVLRESDPNGRLGEYGADQPQ